MATHTTVVFPFSAAAALDVQFLIRTALSAEEVGHDVTWHQSDINNC